MFGRKKSKGDDKPAKEKKAKPKKEPKAKKEKKVKEKKVKEKKTKTPKPKKERVVGPKVSIGEQLDVFTVMLGISLVAVVISCLLLFLELSTYGSFPWWKVS